MRRLRICHPEKSPRRLITLTLFLKVISDQTGSSQTRSDQIRPNPVRSYQIKSSQMRSRYIRTDQKRSDKVKSDQIKLNDGLVLHLPTCEHPLSEGNTTPTLVNLTITSAILASRRWKNNFADISVLGLPPYEHESCHGNIDIHACERQYYFGNTCMRGGNHLNKATCLC